MNGIKNIKLLATCCESGLQGDIHPISNGAFVWDQSGKIIWVGQTDKLPAEYINFQFIDAEDNLVIPGLIDCHTHLGFSGWRSDEFELRILGKPYIEIEKAGGGIVSTVEKTRKSNFEDLKKRCLTFLSQISKYGVTTIECKSGYGLDSDTEIKLLKIYKDLSKEQPISIISTFLGAHTFPKEFKDDRAGYIKIILDEMLPIVSKEKLATFCDAFVESSAFTLEEAELIFKKAKSLGLIPKIHADQFSDSGGAKLAASIGAISADHLECTGIDGIRALKKSNVVAVLLPLASTYTNQKPALGRTFIDEGVKVAISTDFNPGSAPSFNIQLAMFLACTLNRLTPNEVLKGVTINAAHALGLQDQIGSIEVGKFADFAIIDADSPNEWMYHQRENRCIATYKYGNKINCL